MKRHLPGYAKRLFIGSAKHLVAGPGKVLVDDHDTNVDAFAGAGGLTVQPPRPWNRFNGSCLPGGSFDVPEVFGYLAAAVSVANPGSRR